MNDVTAKTRLTALLGTPIRHSYSPTMHNCAFHELGLDLIYLAFETDQQNLKATLDGLKAMDFAGGNITMPNKVAVIEYLDEISETSRLTGSVNTVVCKNGKLYGTITDGIGYMRSLDQYGYDIIGKKIVIFGSGGAATAVAVQAAMEGVAEISFFVRNIHERARHIVDTLNQQTNCKATVHLLTDVEMLRHELKESVLLCNCTPVGMGEYRGESLIKDPTLLYPELIVTDVIYSPAKTRLLEIAEEIGCPTMNGLGMMLYQGAEAFKLWTGKDMPIEKVKAILPF